MDFFGALLFVVANLPESLFAMANLKQSAHTLIVFLLLLSSPIGFYFMLLINWRSCQNEFGADQFGASLTSAESLANALLVLVKENNSFPLAHPLYMRFYYSHPPLMVRLKALGCEDFALSQKFKMESQIKWSIKQSLEYGAQKLRQCGIPRPVLESEILLGFILKQSRADLHCHFEEEINSFWLESFKKLIARRSLYEPIEYLVESVSFLERSCIFRMVL